MNKKWDKRASDFRSGGEHRPLIQREREEVFLLSPSFWWYLSNSHSCPVWRTNQHIPSSLSALEAAPKLISFSIISFPCEIFSSSAFSSFRSGRSKRHGTLIKRGFTATRRWRGRGTSPAISSLQWLSNNKTTRIGIQNSNIEHKQRYFVMTVPCTVMITSKSQYPISTVFTLVRLF